MGIVQSMLRVIARSSLVALWPYINKFGKWPVGARVIRFATGVYKHSAGSSYMLLQVSSMVCTQLKQYSECCVVNHASNGLESCL